MIKINKQSKNQIEELYEVSESEDDSKHKIKKEKSAKTDKTPEKIRHEKDLSNKYKVRFSEITNSNDLFFT